MSSGTAYTTHPRNVSRPLKARLSRPCGILISSQAHSPAALANVLRRIHIGRPRRSHFSRALMMQACRPIQESVQNVRLAKTHAYAIGTWPHLWEGHFSGHAPSHPPWRFDYPEPQLQTNLRTCVYSRYARYKSQVHRWFLGSPESLDNARLIWTLPLAAAAWIRRSTLLHEEAERGNGSSSNLQDLARCPLKAFCPAGG